MGLEIGHELASVEGSLEFFRVEKIELPAFSKPPLTIKPGEQRHQLFRGQRFLNCTDDPDAVILGHHDNGSNDRRIDGTDDNHGTSVRAGAKLAKELDPVHPGHIDITYIDIDWLSELVHHS